MRKIRLCAFSIPVIGKSLAFVIALLIAVSYGDAKGSAQNFPNFTQWQSGDFRGFNVSRSIDSNWAVFQSINANAARHFISLTKVPGTRRYQMSQSTYQNLDEVIAQARRRNFKIIVTFNPLPKAPHLTYWFNTEEQNSIVSILEGFADRYAGETAIAGLDMLNEPYPVTQGHRDVPRNFDGLIAWENLGARIINAVRRQDPTRVIIYEFPYWAGMYKTMRPIPFQGVVYSSHWYTPQGLTHQGIAGRPMGVSYPSYGGLNGTWNKEVIRKWLQPVRNFQLTYRLPVYFGEFSCNRKAPGRSSTQYNMDVVSLFEEYGWSWTFHSFRGAPEWDAELPRGISSDGRSLSTELMTYLRQQLAKNP